MDDGRNASLPGSEKECHCLLFASGIPFLAVRGRTDTQSVLIVLQIPFHTHLPPKWMGKDGRCVPVCVYALCVCTLCQCECENIVI